jgi:hypothetical protein
LCISCNVKSQKHLPNCHKSVEKKLRSNRLQWFPLSEFITSNQSDEKFCSYCDPSPIKAITWCSDCDDLLCSDCLRQHKSSKLFKTHTTISLEDYKELTTVVQALNYHCQDHDENLDLFCPIHSRPCCIRCSLTSHKECAGVAPIKDVTQNVKSSPAMLDLFVVL